PVRCPAPGTRLALIPVPCRAEGHQRRGLLFSAWAGTALPLRREESSWHTRPLAAKRAVLEAQQVLQRLQPRLKVDDRHRRRLQLDRAGGEAPLGDELHALHAPSSRSATSATQLSNCSSVNRSRSTPSSFAAACASSSSRRRRSSAASSGPIHEASFRASRGSSPVATSAARCSAVSRLQTISTSSSIASNRRSTGNRVLI